MKPGSLVSTVLWVLFFGCIGLTYGLPGLLGEGSASALQRMQGFAVLFAFGLWVGIVAVGEKHQWFPRVRRFVNASLLASLAVVAVGSLASPSTIQVLLLAVGFAVAGYFAERWLPYA